MKEQISAGIITFRVKDNSPEYLLLHYPHGHWDLPKGKLEAEESLEQAALRELKEETDLSAHLIDGFKHSFDYIFKHDGELIKKTVVFFLGQASGGEITLSHEHIGFEWLSYQDAHKRLTFDNAKQLLEQANDFLAIHPLLKHTNN
ncbi:bis(5'-nucleosyl)-tetraphosphatase, partial [Candidatus Dependentiae bacterium]